MKRLKRTRCDDSTVVIKDVEPCREPIAKAKARLVEGKVDPGVLIVVAVAVKKYGAKWRL